MFYLFAVKIIIKKSLQRNSSTDSNAQNSSNNSKQHNSAEIIQVSMASPTTAQQSAIPVTISIPSSRHYLKTYTIQKQVNPKDDIEIFSINFKNWYLF